MKTAVKSSLKTQLAILATFFLASSAFADWQADVVTTFSRKDVPTMQGKMSVKNELIRIDMSTPMEMSVIVQKKKNKAYTLMHPAKVVMDADLKQYEKQIPACSTGAPESCYGKLGLKKTGSETVDGKSCVVYEGTVKGRAKDGSEDVAMKIWHPTAAQDGPPAKFTVKTKDGETIESKYTNVKTGPLAASLFDVPKGYQRAGNMEDLLKGFKGFGGGDDD